MSIARIINRLFLVSFLSSILLGVFLGCGYPSHIDPLLYTYDSEILVEQSAALHAEDLHGIYLYVLNTHSMEPVLYGGDYIVVDTHASYSNVKLGVIIVYHADWAKPTDPPVVHRVLAKDSAGLLVGGDNVDSQHTENQWRVTEKNYVGTVVGIYRMKRDQTK